MIRSLFSLLVATALFVPCALADAATLAPITLLLDEEREVADAPAGSAGSSSNTDAVEVKANSRTLVAKAPGKATVTFSGGAADATVEVTVANVTPVVRLDGKDVALSGQTVVYSGRDLPLQVQAPKADGTLKEITGDVKVTSSNPGVIDYDKPNKKLQIKVPAHADLIDPPAPAVRIDLKFGDQTIPVNFIVAEAPTAATVELPSRIQEQSSKLTQVKVTGAGGGTYPSTSTRFAGLYQYKCSADGGVARMQADQRTLEVDKLADNQSTAPVTVKCNILAVDGSPLLQQGISKNVVAFQSGGTIVLTPNTLSLFAGQNSKVEARLLGRDRKEITDRAVEFSVDNGVDGATVAKQGDRAAIVTVSKDRSKLPAGGQINVTARAVTETGAEVTATLPVTIVNAAGFTRVRGGLEMIDYETAKDLYGSRTAEDFYIAKITLLNDLGGDHAGASILVFSSSLGIGVNLQKAPFVGNKMRKRDVKKLVDEEQWKPITYGDLRKLGLPINYPLGVNEVPHMSHPGSPGLGIDKEIVYTCDDIWYAEQAAEAFELTADEAKLPKEDRERIIQEKRRQRDERAAAARLRQLRYRPYPYDMVIKSFDPRDNRTGRSRTFRALTFAGSVASFITGVPNFGATSQFMAVSDKVANVLIPGLAVYWPSLRETQRQNLIDDTMHPIEEIPYGSSLTKMIFLPKYPFQGLQADHWFRISEICPFDFQLEVAISHKERQMVPVSPTAN
ncbi:MAG TPA: hypothetical protein VGF28_01805 [Thermoanaerobaculia bacterium]|jgi:hypothetical protein